MCDKLFILKRGTMLNKLNNRLNLVIEGNTLTDVKNKSIQVVSLPNTINTISTKAFSLCESLTEVFIPESVREIDRSAFRFCFSLSSVVIPDSVTEMGDSIFYGCRSLSNIKLPNYITEIPNYTFYNCSSLMDVTIPNSVETIGDYAFENCSTLYSVDFHSSLRKIGTKAFANCYSLKDITLPNSLETIGNEAFLNCSSLETVIIPKSVTSIGFNAFRGCQSLKTIIIPNSVKKIGFGAFADCPSLTQIILPDSLTQIEENTFANCRSLESVYIPSSIEDISSRAFRDCIALKAIIIPESISIINRGTFAACKSLTEVKLPEGLKFIDAEAFYGCYNLANIEIPDSVQSIGMTAFYGCRGLKHVTIPNSVTEISNRLFGYCRALQSVTLPDSITRIGPGAFMSCSALKKIVLPASVTEIQASAFTGCGSLTSIEILSPNIKIGEGAFAGCRSLTSINNIRIEHSSDSIYSLTRFPKECLAHARIKKVGNDFNLDISRNEFETPDETKKEIKNPYLLNYYMRFYDDKKKWDFLSKIDTNFAKYLYSKDISFFDDNIQIDYNKIFDYNIKSINNLLKSINDRAASVHENITNVNLENFFKFCENLGVLNNTCTTVKTVSKSGNKKIQEIDYAQKTREFLKDKILSGVLPLARFNAMFEDMELKGFKQGFTDFFLNKNNFDELMIHERLYPGFIAKCYNEFEAVQAAHTSQRGSQRKLAPTVEFFYKYFLVNKFNGITEETKAIAATISPYFSSQADFDNAVNIDNERKMKKIADHIIGEEIKEETVFEKVDSLIQQTKEVAVDTTATLVDLASRKFTYEFLSKSDPANFVLGKLCNCCAHLEGVGNGIMCASIVHPDVQNIVIRDKHDVIVAKSTLYVNREEGYGVCNNIEVNTDISEEDKKLIYQKFKKAIETFANKYNKKYPNKPLRIITVGMHLNDLENEITQHDKRSQVLYKAIDYGDYAFVGSGYSGDSDKEQYTLWQSDDDTNNNNV